MGCVGIQWIGESQSKIETAEFIPQYIEMKKLFILACIVIILAACGGTAPTLTAGEVQTVVALTFAGMTESSPTSTPEAPANVAPSLVVVESPTAELPPATFNVQTTAQNVNLRTGPGTLFQVSRVLAQGTTLEAQGRSRGAGEWLYVKTNDNIFGWVVKDFVEIGGHDGTGLLIKEPVPAQFITGVVVTELGTPVSGIGFALLQGTNRTDTFTNEEGRFFFYLPTTLTGTWTISYVSINCTSNTMDVNCNCISVICGAANPANIEITLPYTGELNFIWK